jgi:hypothetical protein
VSAIRDSGVTMNLDVEPEHAVCPPVKLPSIAEIERAARPAVRRVRAWFREYVCCSLEATERPDAGKFRPKSPRGRRGEAPPMIGKLAGE